MLLDFKLRTSRLPLIASDFATVRPLADAWCRLSEGNLLRAGAAVRPLRAAAVARLALMGEDAPVDDDAGSAAGSLAPSSVSEP